MSHYKRAHAGKSIDTPIRYPQVCAVAGCAIVVRSAKATPLCKTHTGRVRNGNLGAPRSRHSTVGPCSFDGCGMQARSFGLCVGHYAQTRRGLDLTPLRRATNRFVTSNGYVQLYRPDLGWTAAGWVMEHRVVLAELLGRDLLPGENVHHRNGLRADNRLENLELWVSSQPSGQRVEDVVAHAVEMLGRYAPDRLA